MTDQTAAKQKQEQKEVRKPFLTGAVLDERTVRSCLAFFGSMILVIFISFITALSSSFDSNILKLIINAAAIVLAMIIYFNNGSKRGTEDIKKGEILWQRKEKGQPFTESEQKLCFHPFKGYFIGLIGSVVFVVLAVILALNTSLKMTEAGGLPSWMQAYTKRSDIGNALVNYTQPEGLNFLDYIRAAVRVIMLPYVNIVGGTNRSGILLLERISPLIMLLPAVAYGTGYLSGQKVRTQIHTAISENERKRIRREQRRRDKAVQRNNRGPERLN